MPSTKGSIVHFISVILSLLFGFSILIENNIKTFKMNELVKILIHVLILVRANILRWEHHFRKIELINDIM